MHLRIHHQIRCRFDGPARNLIAILRLAPRSHEGQHVSDWWIDSDIDCSLKAGNDEFGNLTHTFSAAGPIRSIAITATGVVDTFDMAGVTRGTAERLPLDIFLRETVRTAADADVRRFADTIGAREATVLGKLHALMEGVGTEVALESGSSALTAAEAFARKTGGMGSHAHVFIAAARHLGVPARYVSGYLIGEAGGDAVCHAWAEAHVSGLGWVGFDPVNNLCPQGGHVRFAAGLDELGAAFMRGSRSEQATHLLKVDRLA